MKKIILSFLLSVFTVVGFSQDSTKVDNQNQNALCLNTSVRTMGYVFNYPRLQTYYQPTPYVGVNLHLSTGNYKYTDSDTRKSTFACLLISGIAFTTASILEGGYQYGSWQPNPQPGYSTNTTYVTPPFWQQTPRQIMLCVGVGFTLVGGIGLISSGK